MFKLINFFESPHLNQLRYEMGAPMAKNFNAMMKITLLDDEAIRRLGVEGIDVNFEEIKPQKDKTLGYKGQRVLVYIRDVNQYKDKSEIKLPKFHVSYCKTLDEMRSAGRWQRYVVANKDDGYFSIRINSGDAEFKKLNICQFCLENLSWNNFSRFKMTSQERKNSVAEFSIPEFFKKFPKSLFSVTPTYTSDTAAVNDYTHNWAEVSETLKKERNYRCDNHTCRIQLSGIDRKYLHVHHINGLKNDNSKPNLSVLCIQCHANEPYHAHMKLSIYYKEFISKYG